MMPYPHCQRGARFESGSRGLRWLERRRQPGVVEQGRPTLTSASGERRRWRWRCWSIPSPHRLSSSSQGSSGHSGDRGRSRATVAGCWRLREGDAADPGRRRREGTMQAKSWPELVLDGRRVLGRWPGTRRDGSARMAARPAKGDGGARL